MTKKVLLKITGMHCTSCALDIDGVLEDMDGVLSSNTNYAKSQTEVEFDSDKLSELKIAKVIKTFGYDALAS